MRISCRSPKFFQNDSVYLLVEIRSRSGSSLRKVLMHKRTSNCSASFAFVVCSVALVSCIFFVCDSTPVSQAQNTDRLLDVVGDGSLKGTQHAAKTLPKGGRRVKNDGRRRRRREESSKSNRRRRQTEVTPKSNRNQSKSNNSRSQSHGSNNSQS